MWWRHNFVLGIWMIYPGTEPLFGNRLVCLEVKSHTQDFDVLHKSRRLDACSRRDSIASAVKEIKFM